VEQNISTLRDNDTFRRELEEVPKLAMFFIDSMSDMSGHPSVKRRRISSSPLVGANVGAVELYDFSGDNTAALQMAVGAGATGDDEHDGEPGDDQEAVVGGNVVL
jgi:hypothetical protein